MSKTAIACASGGFRGAFVHGVLTAFEEQGFRADTYAAVSSSALAAASAAAGQASAVGIDHWLGLLETRARHGGDMSPVLLESIEAVVPAIVGDLFAPDASRFITVACAVAGAAAAETQGNGARRLGRRLLVAAARGDGDWVRENLEAVLFDSAGEAGPALKAENLAAAIYASTRMMHAWSVPAVVDGAPFVDGCYLLACPGMEMAALGHDRIIAVGTQPGPIPLDLVGDRLLPAEANGIAMEIIVPELDPAALGIDVTNAASEGLKAYYEHGRQKGRAFLS
jgi:predicted acylesterase/phospholipase RssA